MNNDSSITLSRLGLIKTVKFDKYDRYLVDVFIGDLYVNQKLVDQGHSVVVEG